VFSLPLFNLVAGVAISRLSHMGKKNVLVGLFSALLKLVVVLLVLTIPVQMHINTFRYPGGQAFARLHELETNDSDKVQISIDAAAMHTGAFKFGELRKNWAYVYEEEREGPEEYDVFAYMLASDPLYHAQYFDVAETFEGFKRLRWVGLQEWAAKLGAKATAAMAAIRADANVGPREAWAALMTLLPVEIVTNDQIYLLSNRASLDTE